MKSLAVALAGLAPGIGIAVPSGRGIQLAVIICIEAQRNGQARGQVGDPPSPDIRRPIYWMRLRSEST